MPIKKYESRYHEEAILIHLANGKEMRIAFKGGSKYPRPHGGVFVTDNTEIQEAIERRKNFGTAIRLVETNLTRAEQEKKNDAFLQKLAPKEAETPEKTLAPSSTTTVPGVTNALGAREYILKNFPGTVFKEVLSKTLILEFARKHQLVFPDWV